MNLQQTKPEDIKAIPHDEGEPQKGKVLACYTILASLYGEELKRNILDLAKDGQPIKPAVMLFSKEGQADIAIAAGIVKAIKMDFEKHRSSNTKPNRFNHRL